MDGRKEMRTKQGYVMNLALRRKIVMLLAEGMSQQAAARLAGVHTRTVRDYLVPDVLQEIKALHAKEDEPTLEHVDKAIMKRAAKGDVAAARLAYMRMAQKGGMEPLPTLEEIEKELRELKNGKRRQAGAAGKGGENPEG